MKAFITTTSIALFLGTGSLFAQEACSVYEVRAGDSLSNIAKTAYGEINFSSIYNANRDIIGKDPNLLKKGQKLSIPCADGSVAKSESDTEKVKVSSQETEKTVPVEPEMNDGPVEITLVTAGGYKPLTDEGLEGGGIYTQLVTAAAKTLEPDYNVTTTFINDWGSHLEALVPSMAYDGAFPWTRPECESDGSGLSDNSKWRCAEFVHTKPFYEIVNVLFVIKGSELETTDNAKDFHGKTICLPESYTDQSLTYHGLIADKNIKLFRPVNEHDCMEAILAGTIDAVALEIQQGSRLTVELGAADEITMNQNLLHVQPLNVFVSKNNPDKDVILKTLNRGLQNIRESGEWAQIVKKGLSENN